jgi:predicted metal-dependent RNase
MTHHCRSSKINRIFEQALYLEEPIEAQKLVNKIISTLKKRLKLRAQKSVSKKIKRKQVKKIQLIHKAMLVESEKFVG